jgi:hypothetical protein
MKKLLRLILPLALAACGAPGGHPVALCDDEPDAGVDAAPDAAIDASLDALVDAPPIVVDPSAAWPRRKIFTGAPGPDGADFKDANGDGRPDALSGHEEAGEVVISFNPGMPALLDPGPDGLGVEWPSVRISGSKPNNHPAGGPLDLRVGAVEDSKYADLDCDGDLDVLVASESKKLLALRNPTKMPGLADDPARALVEDEWLVVLIKPSIASQQRWMQIEARDRNGDGCVDAFVAGGKVSVYPAPIATLGVWSWVDPWDGETYGYQPITEVGWNMSSGWLTSTRIHLSDRVYIDRDPGSPIVKDYHRSGSRWLEQLPSGAWVEHVDHPPTGQTVSPSPYSTTVVDGTALRLSNLGEAKFHHVDQLGPGGAWRLIACWSSDNKSNLLLVDLSAGWEAPWPEPIAIAGPLGAGQCHDLDPGDVDGDGVEDLVVSFADAGEGLSYTKWGRGLGGGLYEWREVTGPTPGEKPDNVLLADVDGDGCVDSVETEQNHDGPDRVGNDDGIKGLGVSWRRRPARDRALARRRARRRSAIHAWGCVRPSCSCCSSPADRPRRPSGPPTSRPARPRASW